MVGAQHTTEQRDFMVTNYHKTHDVAQTIQRFQERFPDREPPAGRTVMRNVSIKPKAPV